MTELPTLATDASPEFITACLRESGLIGASTAVAEVSAEPIGEGVGIVGQLARLTLRYDGRAEGAPSSMIFKIPSQYPQNRAIGDHFNFYEREGRFYEQLAGRVDVRVPRCYANILEPETGTFALLLEDFGGRTMISQVAGMGVDRAVEAVRSIATVHAAFWEAPELADLGWMPHLNDPINLAAGQSYREAWPLFVDALGGDLPDGAVALGDRVQHVWEDMTAAMFERLPTTVAHGDFRVDNLMFDDDAPRAGRVGVIDWQISYRGPGIMDVCYLMTQSMDETLCREAEGQVVTAWYDALCQHLGGQPSDFSRDDAWREYRMGSLGNTVYPVTAVGSMDLANERGRQLAVAMGRRSFGAALALDAAEFLPA